MLAAPPLCKWCETPLSPLAENQTHFLVEKPHQTHPAVLVVTRRHVGSPFELTAEEWVDLGAMVKEARTYLERFNPTGFTLGWNVGEAGGQHVLHAHMHIICRFDAEQQVGRGLRDFLLR